MKKKISKALLMVFSITTIILAFLSLYYLENWLLRVFTQASLGLMMLFNGIHAIPLQKGKSKTGYIFIGVALATFLVMINTIVAGFKIGAF